MTADGAPCVFCEIVAGRAPAAIVGKWHSDIAITPLNPVTDGHVIVIPRVHVPDATTSANVSGQTMRQAVRLARGMGPCNIIASIGAEATQTVMHLHVHIVPRRAGDGLHLPWTGQGTAGGHHRSPHHHEGRIMTSWNLNLTEQTDTVLRTMAALDTDDPKIMAATLRTAADRLDPPEKVIYRRQDGPQLTGHLAAGAPPVARWNLVTPDGCGPEHTFTGACHLAPPPGGLVD